MLTNSPDAYVAITHIPTGERVFMPGGWRETFHTMKARALKVLRARLWLRKHGPIQPLPVVADYVIDTENPWPHDLSAHRIGRKLGETP